jgi:hypothetical protein
MTPQEAEEYGNNSMCKWDGYCIDTAKPSWLRLGKITLISGLSKGNPLESVDSKHPLKKDGIDSWEDAKKMASSMGTRPVTRGDFMMAYRANSGNPKFPKNIAGWVGQNANMSSGVRMKIDNQGNGVVTDESECGVWVWDDASSLTYMGDAQCGKKPFPCATNKRVCKLSCDQKGFCWKNNKCYPMTYIPDPTIPKPIARSFSGIPDYLNSGFYHQGKFIAIKQNEVYVYDGSNASSSHLQNMFIGYPLTKNVLGEVQHDAKTDQSTESGFYDKEKSIQERNAKLMRRGEEALAMSEQVVNDQNQIYNKNEQSIGGLEKSIHSTQRQVTIAESDDRKHRAKLYYLKALLTLSVIEIIVFVGLKALAKKIHGSSAIAKFVRKLANKRKIIIAVVAGLFLILLIPRIMSDLKMSRMRWGLKQWVQPFPGDDVEGDDEHEHHQNHHNHHKHHHSHHGHHLKKRCKALAKSKSNDSDGHKDDVDMSAGVKMDSKGGQASASFSL